jgi:MFS superfamily sulfate permease-like transporter
MKSLFAHLNRDLPAGLVVFLVAVPLCLGIAAVSGVPAFSGLIAGFVGGIVVGIISGSQLGVSGPAAGLAVIVFSALDEFKSSLGDQVAQAAIATEAFQLLLLSIVLAGAIQTFLGFLNGGIIGYYFPSSVIKGMLAGIGLTIFLKEIPHALGYDKHMEGDITFYHLDGENTFTDIINAVGNTDFGALIISAAGLVILAIWQRPFMTNQRIWQILQGPLVAILAGIVLVFVFAGSSLEMVKEHLVTVPVANNVSEFLGSFTLPNFGGITNPLVWQTAFVIAIVASLETLLCVEATDKLDPERRITPTNLELKAQGIGNIVSGLIGGLPITQVIVRSSANIQSGGKTKMSAILHGFFIFGFVAFLPQLLNLIPRASLAAILIIVGYKLATPSLFKEMWYNGKNQFIPFMLTVLFIVFKDLLWGVGIGLVVAIFEILYLNFKKPYLVDLDPDKKHFVFKLTEDVTFIHKASIMETLSKIPADTSVLIDATDSQHIHPDIVEIIHDFETHARFMNIEVEVRALEEAEVTPSTTRFKKLLKNVRNKAE